MRTIIIAMFLYIYCMQFKKNVRAIHTTDMYASIVSVAVIIAQ